MPITVRTSVAIPVQALAWLGNQGTRAIAALVFISMALPPLGELLKPFVTEAIFLLLTERLSKTAGHVIPVDGGLQDGFLR